jgi:hypothetical protein
MISWLENLEKFASAFAAEFTREWVSAAAMTAEHCFLW